MLLDASAEPSLEDMNDALKASDVSVLVLGCPMTLGRSHNLPLPISGYPSLICTAAGLGDIQ